MTLTRKLAILLLAGFAGIFAVMAPDQFAAPGSFRLVSTAEARVGRPLTPVSVAGVARRTTRRCAAGVYYC